MNLADINDLPEWAVSWVIEGRGADEGRWTRDDGVGRCWSVQRTSDGGAVVMQMRLGSRVGCVSDGVRAAGWGGGGGVSWAGVCPVRRTVAPSMVVGSKERRYVPPE